MEFTFLMCSERSGSNLITRLLDSHSRYCGPSPTHLFRILLDHRDRYGDLSDDGNWSRLVGDAVELFNTQIGVWRTTWDPARLTAATPRRTLGALLATIYGAEAEAHGKPRIFIKENHLYRYLPFLLAEFPDLRVVWVVRDPRDMALSWKRSPNLRGCVIRAARTWQADQSEALRVYAQLRESGRIALLRYEDLVADAPAVLEPLCAALGIPFEPEMTGLDRNAWSARIAERSADWENVRKPIMSTNFNKYHGALSEAEIRTIEARCGTEMDLLSYARDYEMPGDIALLEAEIAPLELHEKPAYQDLPEAERRARAARHAVVKAIAARPRLSPLAMETAPA